MQLKKINQDHYVVVTDETIDVNDLFLDDTNTIRQSVWTLDKEFWDIRKDYKKITHSTQPLNKEFNDWFDVKMLDLSYIKSLVGEVDVEKKAEHHYDMMYLMEKNDNIKPYVIRDYSIGYKQCLEDNKDKRFSEEDLRKAIEMAREQIFDESEIEKIFEYSYNEIIFSLTQPKDTWECEFIDGQLKLK